MCTSAGFALRETEKPYNTKRSAMSARSVESTVCAPLVPQANTENENAALGPTLVGLEVAEKAIPTEYYGIAAQNIGKALFRCNGLATSSLNGYHSGCYTISKKAPHCLRNLDLDSRLQMGPIVFAGSSHLSIAPLGPFPYKLSAGIAVLY